MMISEFHRSRLLYLAWITLNGECYEIYIVGSWAIDDA